MLRSHRAYYWLVVFLIPCMLGIDQCGTRLFLTGEVTKNSPTEPCVEHISTPTPAQILSPPGSSDPEPQNTPLIQDGEVIVVVTPIILPTPTISAQYTVTITNSSFCDAIDPIGTVIKSSGDTITFTIYSSTTCSTSMYVDGSFYQSFGVPPATIYIFTVTGNHVIEFL